MFVCVRTYMRTHTHAYAHTYMHSGGITDLRNSYGVATVSRID